MPEAPGQIPGVNGGNGSPQSNGTASEVPVKEPLDRPDPDFEVSDAVVVPRSSTPTLRFNLGVSDESGMPIHFISLAVLITVEPGMRSYDAESRERLVELFGEPERWGSTTGAFRWTQIDTVVPAFSGKGNFSVTVPCTYDHEISATKYFGGVEDGTYPLQFHFNGTTYYETADGRLQMLPLAWDRSARFELPVSTWRAMIDAHYPNGGWLRLSQKTLQDLGRHKAESGSPTMDDCVRGLLDRAGAEDVPAAGERKS